MALPKGNLLIVDDEKEFVQCLVTSLGGVADNIFTAYDGTEALQLLKSERIHCVLCDMRMPKLNGFEVLKRLRSFHPDVSFIFFTAYDNDEILEQAKKLNALDLIVKPELNAVPDIVKDGLIEGLRRLENETCHHKKHPTIVTLYRKQLTDNPLLATG